MIADAVAVIDRAVSVDIGSVETSRWTRWERAVLAGCVADATEFAAVLSAVGDRRAVEDGDSENAGALRGEIAERLRNGSSDPTNGVYELPADMLAAAARQQLDVKANGRAAAMRRLAQHTSSIPELAMKRVSAGARYFWVGERPPEDATLRASEVATLRKAADYQKRTDDQKPHVRKPHPEATGPFV